METISFKAARRDVRNLSSREAVVANWEGWVQGLVLAAAEALPAGEPTDVVSVRVTTSREPSVSLNVLASSVPAVAVQDAPPVDPGNPAALRSAAREAGDEAAAAAYVDATAGRAA